MSAAVSTSWNWVARSACLDEDPEHFFPISKTGRAEEQIARAKAVCASCVVKAPCLEFAIRTDADDGIWGGMDPSQRRRIKRSLGRVRTRAS